MRYNKNDDPAFHEAVANGFKIYASSMTCPICNCNRRYLNLRNLATQCGGCAVISNRRCRARHPHLRIREREYSEQWRLKQPERVKRMRDEYYKRNREECLARHSRWQEENRDKVTEYHRGWRERNREHMNAYYKAYRAKKKLHKEKDND